MLPEEALGHAPEEDYEGDGLDVDPVPGRCSVSLEGPVEVPDDDFLDVSSVVGKPGSVISDLFTRVKARFAR